MTTQEKVRALAGRLGSLDFAELAPDLAWVVEGITILRGLGIGPADPLAFLLPSDPAETDVLIDKLIALLLELRGDELPPFDPTRYGESIVSELIGLTHRPEPS